MKTILKNNVHKHFPIGGYVMAVLVLILSQSESLRMWEVFMLASFGTFIICWLWDWNQDRILPEGEKQTSAQFWGDILTGFLGGIAYLIAFLIGIPIVYLIVISLVGIGLEIYKKSK